MLVHARDSTEVAVENLDADAVDELVSSIFWD